MLRANYDASIVSKRSDGVAEEKTAAEPRRIWLSNVLFVTAIHLVAFVALLAYRPHKYTLWMCAILWQASCLGTHLNVLWSAEPFLGVTMGYHRLWSHKTFEASLPLRILLAGLGTMAFQGSIKWWVFRHRLHHRYQFTRPQ